MRSFFQNQRAVFLLIVVVAGVAAAVFVYTQSRSAANTPAGNATSTSQGLTADEMAVENVVTAFGKKLASVPLSASKDIVTQAIKDNYTPFVSADLLANWENDPSRAPGRLVSSPWPDRIEIGKIGQDPDGAYEVGGQVIEITSNEVEHGGVADSYQVAMKLRKVNGAWLITGFLKELPIQ